MSARTVYLVARTWWGFCFHLVVTTSLVYMVIDAGLDPLQMVLVGTALELSALLFEIPTGIVADAYSRKWSVIIGQVMIGLGFLWFALVPEFWAIVLAQVIWGTGYTFISGAWPAWLSDEVGVGEANSALMTGARLGHAGGLVGIALAVAFAHVSLALPMILGAAGFIALAVALAVFMKETGFTPVDPERRASWRGLADGVSDGIKLVRARRVLLLILLVAVVLGLFSEGMDRLYVPHLIAHYEFPVLEGVDTVIWWGLIAAMTTLASLGSTTLAQRYVDLDDHRSLSIAVAWTTLGMGAALLAFANLPWFISALVAYWICHAFRAASTPLQTAWLNRLVPSESRATLLSMQGQADAVGQSIGGPAVGWIARDVSTVLAMSISAVLLTPSAWLYRSLARYRD